MKDTELDDLVQEAREAFPAADGSLGRRMLDALLLYKEAATRNYTERVDPLAALGSAARAVGEGAGEVTLEYVSPSPYDTDIEERLSIEVRREVKPWPPSLGGNA